MTRLWLKRHEYLVQNIFTGIGIWKINFRVWIHASRIHILLTMCFMLQNSSHFCNCPKMGHGFPTSYVKVFFMFNDLRWEVIVCFVDIVDHHRLNFLFIYRYYSSGASYSDHEYGCINFIKFTSGMSNKIGIFAGSTCNQDFI